MDQDRIDAGEAASGRERRRHRRAKIHLEAILERTPPEENIRLTVVDFSVGGFFCRTSHPMELGTMLGVTFVFPPYAEHAPKRIEASAVVIRCEPTSQASLASDPVASNAASSSAAAYDMAACFMSLQEETKDHIQGYVDWHALVYGGADLALEGN